MANDIKTKIQLDGEKEYSAALKEANRNLRTLRSELKAETAEMGKNASESEKAAKKQESLKRQIKEQEKIVKTYTEALQEVREKYGDNEDEIAKWEQRLNNARATLGDMRSALQDTTDALQGVGRGMEAVGSGTDQAVVATNSLAETLGRIGDVGGGLADNIQQAFTSALGVVENSIGAVWEKITDLATRSNNIVDLAGFWNTDVATIQKYAGAVTAASGTLDDLNGIVTKINSKASTMDREKWLDIVPVSPENYEDQWEFAMAVMDELSKMDAKTRNAKGFELFGNGATKMFDLANDWATVQENLDKFDATKGGFGLTEEETEKMSSLADSVSKLEESWKRLQDMGTVKLFGDLAVNLTGNAQGVLDGILAYMNADTDEERQAALNQIATNITDAFETACDAIRRGVEMLDQLAEELKESDNPTAQALGGIIGGLVDALQWLTEDNMNNVVAALEILAGFWLVGNGAKMGLKIGELVTNLRLLKLFKGGSAGAGGGGGGGTGTNPVVTGIAGQSIFQKIGTSKFGMWLGSLFQGGAGDLLGAGVLGGMVLGDKTAAGRALRDGGTVDEAIEAGKQELAEFGENVQKNAETFADDWARVGQNILGLFGIDTSGGASKSFGLPEDEIVQEQDDTKQELKRSAIILPEVAGTTEELLGEIFEAVDLDDEGNETSLEDRNNAMQYWWDMWKMTQQGQATDEEENAAYDAAMEAWGDDFADAIYAIQQQLDQMTEGERFALEDIPQSWWAESGNSDQLTSSDISGFRGLPAAMAAAAQDGSARGTAQGISGLRIEMDGVTLGRLISPYVSQSIARDLIV